MSNRLESSGWLRVDTLASRALGLSLLLVAASQAAHSPETSRFRSLTDVDGLSQMSAQALAQDRQGLLWIGTQVGLNRYDGAKFRTFSSQRSPNSLSELDVSALLSDPDGSLWVGTLNGLHRFDPATERVEPVLPQTVDGVVLPHPKINALMFDLEGALWIASDEGLSRYRPAQREFVSYGAELADRRVQALAVDGSGGLWVGTAAGLWRFDPRSQRFTPAIAEGAPKDALRGWIRALCRDRDGELWIGTKDAGLLRLSPGSGKLTQWRHDPANPQSISHDRIYALLEDRAGALWIGTEAGADLMMDRATAAPQFVRFQHRAMLPSSIGAGRVVSLMQDEAGDLWFGTWSGGASLLSPVRSRFLSFEADSADPRGHDAAEIVNMASAGREQIWLGTRRGLFLFDVDRNQLQGIAATAGMRVYAVAVDGENLLLGTDQGLYRFDPVTHDLRRAAVPAEVGSPFVDFIVIERDRVWLSTRDADLFVLDRSLSTVLAHHALESRAHFLTSFNRKSKVLGGDKGLYWFSGDGVTLEHRVRANPEDPRALQSDTCHFFLRGSDGQLWLATSAGLHRMELSDPDDPASAQFTVFRRAGGANTNAIKSVIEDGKGLLWMSSNAGIARFDPSTKTFTSYGVADGAIDRGYYAFVHATTAAGQIAFGGASGFTVFDPSRIVDLPPPPRPLLTQLELDNRVVDPLVDADHAVLRQPLQRTAKLVLPAGHARSLALAFASPYFVAPEQLRFAYRLDGFNDKWIETDSRLRLATYTNLAPGEYLFRVRARNSDADWTGEESQLPIVIERFWWQTGWAKFAALVALIAVVSAFFFGRLRWLAHQRRILGEQVAERTADILNLGQVGKELTATLNFEQAAERVYRQVRARLDAHVFLIAIYREAREIVELEYLVEDDSRRAKIEYSMSEEGRPAVWCVRECRELVTATREQLRDMLRHLQPAKQGESMESVVYLPLRVEQRVIGCLSVQSPRQHAYTASHLEFLRALASYTAIALDNADNYRRLDQAVAQTREAMTSMHRTHIALEEAYGRIEHLSLTDALTGLGNRRSLDQRLPTLLHAVDRHEQLVSGKSRLAFFLLDVDRFKSINDEFGHSVGDLVLSSLGNLLKSQFDEPGFVVRWGGEEFLAVMPISDENEALHLGQHLRATVAAHAINADAGMTLRCSVSIGFACYPFDPSAPRRLDSERVIEVADTALYAAKRGGRNLVLGYRCTGPIDNDFESRLRTTPEGLCRTKVLELLGAGASGTVPAPAEAT